MPKTEITNMVMVEDRKTGRVAVIDRERSWRGVAFPGGHLENDESIYDSAVREVREETGLEVRNLKACGFIHWYSRETHDRYFTYFFKTSEYSGELIDRTEEGRVFWIEFDRLIDYKLAPNMGKYLRMFTEEKYSEAFCSWRGDEERSIVYFG